MERQLSVLVEWIVSLRWQAFSPLTFQNGNRLANAVLRSRVEALRSLTLYDLYLGVTCVAMLTMALVAPQGLTWLPAVMAVATLAVMRKVSFLDVVRRDAAALATVGLLLGWALIRSVTAPNPPYALFVFSITLAVLAAGYVNLVGIRAIRPAPALMIETILVWWLALCVCLALILGGAFNLAFLRGARALALESNNRAVCAAALFAPLIVFSIMHLTANTMARIIIGAGSLSLATTVVFASESESAKLVLPLTLLVQALVYVSPRLGRWCIWAVILTIFATPFAVQSIATFIKDASLWTYLPDTFAVRLLLWSELVQLILDSPAYGLGVEVIRWRPVLPANSGFAAAYMHPHSFLLQLWLELGMVGAVLFSIVLVALTASWKRYSRSGSALLHAMAIGAASVSAVSDGLWQTWWTGFLTLYFLFGFVLLANAGDRIGPITST